MQVFSYLIKILDLKFDYLMMMTVDSLGLLVCIFSFNRVPRCFQSPDMFK